jgi:lipopolysaccharide transport system permease protein
MPIDFEDTIVRPEPQQGQLRVGFHLAARDGADLSRVVLGFQVFDTETNLLIVDGARTPMPPDAAAAGSEPEGSRRFPFHLEIPLPSAEGRYRVIISLLEEGAAWLYEKGWPFLLIDTQVSAGHLTVERALPMRWKRLKAEMLWRSIGRAFVYPVRTVVRHRSLIRTMARRDILARYRGSFGGALWTVLNPLLLMLTYFFVFGIVLQARFGNDPSRTGFVLYFLAGMLPWLAFSEALGRAPYVINEHVHFVKKLVFPVETLPLTPVAVGLVTQTFAMGIFVVGLLLARGGIPFTVLWLPVLLIPQVLLTMGLAWFLSALGVYVRDLGQVNSYLLTLWFFLTPICYPVTSVSGRTLEIMSKNPLFVLVEGYRRIFLEAQAPAFGSLWKLYVLSFVVLVLGHAWFYKLRRSFADIL